MCLSLTNVCNSACSLLTEHTASAVHPQQECGNLSCPCPRPHAVACQSEKPETPQQRSCNHHMQHTTVHYIPHCVLPLCQYLRWFECRLRLRWPLDPFRTLRVPVRVRRGRPGRERSSPGTRSPAGTPPGSAPAAGTSSTNGHLA